MNNEEKLTAKLMAARAVMEDALKAVHSTWDACEPFWKYGKDDKQSPGIADALKAWHDAREAYAKAMKYYTRVDNEFKRMTTGVDNRVKVFKYSATLPCGRLVTRKSPRVYTHVVAYLGKDGKWCAEGWAGSERLASARVRKFVGWGYPDARAIAAEVTK